MLSLRAIYSGPEEVIVAAVRPRRSWNVEQRTRAMDDLDRRIRVAVPLVADVFVNVTADRDGADSAAAGAKSS